MSTEHQKYSAKNQAKAIREYAEAHDMAIVRTYADEGKSGLRIKGRDALQQLIDDVETGAADFKVILVYDVSRWGRFQDADESAYYEYKCRDAGMEVEYCAEQFANDGSPVATIVKGVKRAMAGEYTAPSLEAADCCGSTGQRRGRNGLSCQDTRSCSRSRVEPSAESPPHPRSSGARRCPDGAGSTIPAVRASSAA